MTGSNHLTPVDPVSPASHDRFQRGTASPTDTSDPVPSYQESQPPDVSAGPSIQTQPKLQRTLTSTSVHAQTSLRRMATHETGGQEEDHTDNGTGGDGRLTTHQEEETRTEEHEESKTGLHGGKKEIVSQDQTNSLPARQVVFVFVGLTCAIFCSLLDQTIVTTALPTLGRVFNRADIAPWVGTAYSLTSTSLQPIYGRSSDIFGRKFVLIAALVIFFIGSLLCAVAQSMIQLIVFRAIQGIGGGGILTSSMIIVSDVVTSKERGKYQGISGAFVALANSLGPILGGLFTQKASWRWCFWINSPSSALSLLVIIVLLPLRRVKGGIVGKLKAIDWYGSVLTITWAVLVLLGLSWAGNEYPWASAAVLAPLIIGLASLGVFSLVEWKSVALPLVPLRIFRNSTVAAGMAATLFSGMIFYSTLYYLPTYFQIVRGASPIRSGVLILPSVCVQTVTSFSSGSLVSKTGDYWWNLVFGFAIWTVGCGLLSTFTEDTSLGEIVGFQIIYGVGAGQTFQTSSVAIQASVERKEMATATGFRNFSRMLGGTSALTICSTIVNNISRTRIRQAGLSDDQVDLILSDPTATSNLGLTQAQRLEVTRAYAHAIRSCFYFLIPCSAICSLLTVFFIKRVSLKREDDAAKKAEAKAWVDSKKSKKDGRHGSSTPDEASDSRRPSATTSEATAHDPAHVGAENRTSKKVEGALENAGREEAEAAGVGSSERAPVVK